MDECVDITLWESPPAVKFFLLLAHFSTLAVLLTFALESYRRVDISHPVLAVVFQDTVVLCATKAAVLFVILTMTVFSGSEFWAACLWGLVHATLQFHQVSWLCVTGLR